LFAIDRIREAYPFSYRARHVNGLCRRKKGGAGNRGVDGRVAEGESPAVSNELLYRQGREARTERRRPRERPRDATCGGFRPPQTASPTAASARTSPRTPGARCARRSWSSPRPA
jgi:hypothetical protein